MFEKLIQRIEGKLIRLFLSAIDFSLKDWLRGRLKQRYYVLYPTEEGHHSRYSRRPGRYRR